MFPQPLSSLAVRFSSSLRARLLQSALFPFRSLHSGFLCLRPSVASSSFDHFSNHPLFPLLFLSARPFSSLRFSSTPSPFHLFQTQLFSIQPSRLFAFFSPPRPCDPVVLPSLSLFLDGPSSWTNNSTRLLLRKSCLADHLISNRLDSYSYLPLFSRRFLHSSSLHPSAHRTGAFGQGFLSYQKAIRTRLNAIIIDSITL